MPYTANQQRAIETGSRNLPIIAFAGSGTTQVVVQGGSTVWLNTGLGNRHLSRKSYKQPPHNHKFSSHP